MLPNVFLFFCRARTELKASCIVGKWSTSELDPQCKMSFESCSISEPDVKRTRYKLQQQHPFFFFYSLSALWKYTNNITLLSSDIFTIHCYTTGLQVALNLVRRKKMKYILCTCFSLSLSLRVLRIPGWPWTCNSPVSTSHVLELQMCATMPSCVYIF
jgi:hypothetical protein